MMNALINEGKIADYGVSNWTAERIEEAQKYALANNLKVIAAIQLRFDPTVMNDDAK